MVYRVQTLCLNIRPTMVCTCKLPKVYYWWSISKYVALNNQNIYVVWHIGQSAVSSGEDKFPLWYTIFRWQKQTRQTARKFRIYSTSHVSKAFWCQSVHTCEQWQLLAPVCTRSDHIPEQNCYSWPKDLFEELGGKGELKKLGQFSN